MMSEQSTQLLQDAKLITCIMPKGRAARLQQLLISEKGIHASNFHHARGLGRFSPLTARGIGEQPEKEVLELAIAAEQADEVFEFMFFEGEIDQPHGGIIYMISLPKANYFEVPDVPEEQN